MLFQNEGEEFAIRARKDAVVLVLSGEPFNEPIVQQGPFVMNTQDEIQQAVRDFNLGRYGSFGRE
ncbi:MAG: hypothetical protein ABS46_12575 [Cytophagaceae bacterium SCN 52-12]|nr:MAG: hypothetical protein ABS46_12575 [Cytophagaceae bacterium SCN 52-12]